MFSSKTLLRKEKLELFCKALRRSIHNKERNATKNYSLTDHKTSSELAVLNESVPLVT